MAAAGASSLADRVQVVAPTIQMLPVRTPTLPPATHTNTFLVGTREAVLIEPATPYKEEQDLQQRYTAALAQPAPRLLAAPAPQAAPAVPAQAAGQRRPAVGRPAGRRPAERVRPRVAVA